MSKKVLFLTNSNPEEKTGSSMRDDIFLTFYRQNEEFEVDIYYISPEDNAIETRHDGKYSEQEIGELDGRLNRVLDLFRGINNDYIQRYVDKKELLKRDYEAIQVEYPTLFPVARKLSEKLDAELYYDFHNVEYELIEEHRDDIVGKWRKFKMKKREKEAAEKSDESFCCSERDKELLWNIPNIIPNAVNPEDYSEDYERPEEYGDSKVALFLGVMRYQPNVEAAQNIEKIAKQMPEWKFFLVGRKPSEKVKEIGKRNENITVTGEVEKVGPYLQHTDICMAPLNSGSGTRLKILEYLAYEKPVISTSKGAEGLEDIDSVTIVDKLEDYQEEIEKLDGKEGKIPEKYTYKGVHKKLEKLLVEN
jgi:glycosyltransferase involved in cell wall biosynthesis